MIKEHTYSAALITKSKKALIKLICLKFAKARLGHLGKEFSEKQMGAASDRRNELTQRALFCNLQIV